MSNRLFVRGFDANTHLSDLENLFSEVGTVTKATITEREANGVTRQVAYIEMTSPEAVEDCIARYHGVKTSVGVLTVTEDKVHIPDPEFSYKRPVHVQRAPKAKPIISKINL